MEQLESGELVCLSPPSPSFPLIVASFPYLRPPTDHRCTLSVPDHPRPLSATIVPSKLVLAGWIRGEPRDESARIYYEQRSGEVLFFSMKNSPRLLRCNVAHTRDGERGE